MPLTFAHPAVVLPFGKLSKRWLSLTGLVIGSMAPDLEYFLRMRLVSIYSHTWAGLVWFDLPLAYLLVIIYELFMKDTLITHLPAGLNRRFFAFRGYRAYYSLQYFFAIFISVLIGAASHIACDGFTHPHGQFVHDFPVLQRIIRLQGHRIYVFHFLQFAGTAAGMLIIALVCYFLPKGKLTRAKNIAPFWLQVALVTVVVVAIRLAAGISLQRHGDVVITLIDGGLLGLFVACLLTGR
ncbi:MAG: DUF4184 family protein [Mucilaginibacter sp.]